jgi:hypothetical protein
MQNTVMYAAGISQYDIRDPTIMVHQRAKISARISSRAFSSLEMKEHGNGLGPLEGPSILPSLQSKVGQLPYSSTCERVIRKLTPTAFPSLDVESREQGRDYNK